MICGVLLSQAVPPAPRPNILIIFTDDMAYGDVSCYGGEIAPTPNIDKLAAEGTRFTKFYVAAPICSPSRAGLITGMYPARWKIHTFLQSKAGNRAAKQADFLDPKAPSLVRTLRRSGYATAHVGKWHLGGGRDVTNAPPFSDYGYDEHVGTYESPEPDPNLTATNWIWSPHDKVKRWDRSEYFVDKTIDFVRRNRGNPWFVNFWPDDVHNPWVVKDAEGGRRGNRSRKELAVVLAEYDRQIGRLMAGLKNLGMDSNTIVIFTSDNGAGPDFPGNPRALGMRGQKGSLYEGGIRMPFIVRWPARLPAGQLDNTSLLNAVDLFPSLCKVTGAPLPAAAKLDGEDMSSIFFGQAAIRKRPMFWRFGRASTENGSRSPNYAVREEHWKLLVNADGSGVELYDLSSDRNETRNVAEANPAVAKRLKEDVLRWQDSLPR